MQETIFSFLHFNEDLYSDFGENFHDKQQNVKQIFFKKKFNRRFFLFFNCKK